MKQSYVLSSNEYGFILYESNDITLANNPIITGSLKTNKSITNYIKGIFTADNGTQYNVFQNDTAQEIKPNSSTNNQLGIIKSIGEQQINTLYETGEIQDTFIQFNYYDNNIINPFLDESGCIEVNPVQYYGEAFLQSNFMKLI